MILNGQINFLQEMAVPRRRGGDPQANAATSTGSAKGTGKPVAGYIPKEVFEANKGNQDWLSKNYDTLIKSMKKWGK